jgi:hypothetical protein
VYHTNSFSAARHARNERRLARELRAMATEEEAGYWRHRQEAQERQEKRAQEERALLLRDAVRQVVDSDNESGDSDDEEDDLYIFFKPRAGPVVPLPGNSRDKGNKRA